MCRRLGSTHGHCQCSSHFLKRLILGPIYLYMLYITSVLIRSVLPIETIHFERDQPNAEQFSGVCVNVPFMLFLRTEIRTCLRYIKVSSLITLIVVCHGGLTRQNIRPQMLHKMLSFLGRWIGSVKSVPLCHPKDYNYLSTTDWSTVSHSQSIPYLYTYEVICLVHIQRL